jgi:perosamine synthetase
MPPRIPIAYADVTGNEEKYVLEAVRSSWISSTGTFVTRFEQDFATACHARAAITAANGTLALHLALAALDVQPGDEVIVPSLTYVATANVVRYAGAEPVFVDADPATWCIDPRKIEAAITPRTRGIVPVHVYGHPADMDAINAIAERHALWVVEDAAEAHFATYKGRTAGSLAPIAAFSFYGNKVLTAGEGGALTVQDPRLEARARLLKNQGMDPERRYFFPVIGFNYRLTNVACAILCAQLERRATILERRRALFHAYRERLTGIEGIGLQPVAPWAEISPWLYCITVDEAAYGMSRDALAGRLGDANIETRPFFYPLHRLPPYAEASERRGECLPETDRLAGAGMNLPTYNALTTGDIDRIAEVIRRART